MKFQRNIHSRQKRRELVQRFLFSLIASPACKSQHSIRPWEPMSNLQAKQPIPSFPCHRLNCGNCGFHVAITQLDCKGAGSATRTDRKESSFYSAPVGLQVSCRHRHSRASRALKHMSHFLSSQCPHGKSTQATAGEHRPATLPARPLTVALRSREMRP